MFDIRSLEEIIHSKKNGKIHILLLGLLHTCSLVFKIVVILRNFLYDTGVIKIKNVSLPVVSVGNITAGGSGKTPFVLFLLRDLVKKYNVAVLNSGYKAELDNSKSRLTTSCKMGDEAFLIHTHFMGKVPVISGRNRVKSAEIAHKLNTHLLVIDDGMQHRKIARDLEIVTIDSKDPLGGGLFLPRGYLRDSPSRLKNIDLLVISDVGNQQEFLQVKRVLRKYTEAPVVGMRRSVKNFTRFSQGEKVALFCGIAKPLAFIELVKRDLKIDLVYKQILLDHQKFSENELTQFIEKAIKTGAKKVICTEKDFVHYKKKERRIPIVPIELELSILFGKDAYEDLLGAIGTLL